MIEEELSGLKIHGEKSRITNPAYRVSLHMKYIIITLLFFISLSSSSQNSKKEYYNGIAYTFFSKENGEIIKKIPTSQNAYLTKDTFFNSYTIYVILEGNEGMLKYKMHYVRTDEKGMLYKEDANSIVDFWYIIDTLDIDGKLFITKQNSQIINGVTCIVSSLFENLKR